MWVRSLSVLGENRPSSFTHSGLVGRVPTAPTVDLSSATPREPAADVELGRDAIAAATTAGSPRRPASGCRSGSAAAASKSPLNCTARSMTTATVTHVAERVRVRRVQPEREAQVRARLPPRSVTIAITGTGCIARQSPSGGHRVVRHGRVRACPRTAERRRTRVVVGAGARELHRSIDDRRRQRDRRALGLREPGGVDAERLAVIGATRPRRPRAPSRSRPSPAETARRRSAASDASEDSPDREARPTRVFIRGREPTSALPCARQARYASTGSRSLPASRR